MSTQRADAGSPLRSLPRVTSRRPLLALCAISAVAGVFAAPSYANGAPTTWYVDDDPAESSDDCTEAKPCKTISAAVGQASSGDTVRVAAGTYTENVTVDERITIIGAGSGSAAASNTIVQASTSSTPVFLGERIPVYSEAAPHRLVFRQMRIRGANAAAGCSNNSSGINFMAAFDGYLTLDGVVLTDNCNGLNFNATGLVKSITIVNSSLSDNKVLGQTASGLRFASGAAVDGLTISGSSFDRNDAGIFRADSGRAANVSISESTFRDNTWYGLYMGPAVESLRVTDSTISFGGLAGGTPQASADNLYLEGSKRKVRGIAVGLADRVGDLVLSGLRVSGIGNLAIGSKDTAQHSVDFIGIKLDRLTTVPGTVVELAGSNVTAFPISLQATGVASDATKDVDLGSLRISNSVLGSGAAATIGVNFPLGTGAYKTNGTPTLDTNWVPGPLSWAHPRTMNAVGSWWGQASGPSASPVAQVVAGVSPSAVATGPWIVSYDDDPSKAAQPGFWPINIVYSGPSATITSGPSGNTEATTATFAFGADGAAGYECSLDGVDFASCSSPKEYTGLALGEHTFQVRAVDADGNQTGATVTRSWTIVAPAAPTPPASGGVTTQPGSLVETVGPTVFEIPGGNLRNVSGGSTPGYEVGPTSFTSLGYIPLGSITCVPTTNGFCTVETQTEFTTGSSSQSERMGEMQAGRSVTVPPKTARLAPGQSTAVTAELTSDARAFMRPDRLVRMRVTVKATDPAGVTTTKVTTLNLDLPRPELTVRAASRQRITNRGAVTLRVKCGGTDCRVSPRIGFTVTLPKGVKASPSGKPPRGALQPLSFKRTPLDALGANRWSTVRLDLGRYRSAVIRRQLARPRNVAMPITVTAGNATGLQSTVRLTVRARR